MLLAFIDQQLTIGTKISKLIISLACIYSGAILASPGGIE